jgi:hypothetical protein
VVVSLVGCFFVLFNFCVCDVWSLFSLFYLLLIVIPCCSHLYSLMEFLFCSPFSHLFCSTNLLPIRIPISKMRTVTSTRTMDPSYTRRTSWKHSPPKSTSMGRIVISRHSPAVSTMTKSKRMTLFCRSDPTRTWTNSNTMANRVRVGTVGVLHVCVST